MLNEWFKGPDPADVAADDMDVVDSAEPQAEAGEQEDGSSSEEEEDEVTLRERAAIKRRLRELGEPVTFFGEDDTARLNRLKGLELCRDQDELATGSTNVM